MSEKQCFVCGRRKGDPTPEDIRNGLTEYDVKLTHCSDCGECVCGFCSHLGVCCDGDEE